MNACLHFVFSIKKKKVFKYSMIRKLVLMMVYNIIYNIRGKQKDPLGEMMRTKIADSACGMVGKCDVPSYLASSKPLLLSHFFLFSNSFTMHICIIVTSEKEIKKIVLLSFWF